MRCWKLSKALLALSLVLAAGCAPKRALAPRGSELTVMIATDLHYLAAELYDGGAASAELRELRDGKLTTYGPAILGALISEALARRPAALILSGDLSFNGEKASHEELARALARLRSAGIPVLVIPGNHDIRNPYAYSYAGGKKTYRRTIEAADFARIYRDCGYAGAFSRDAASLSYAYKLSEDVWVLMLDSQRYEYNSGIGLVGDSRFRDATAEWMRDIYSQAARAGALVIPVTHQLAMRDPGLAEQADYVIANGEELLSQMAEGGSPAVFSGHLHSQTILEAAWGGRELYDVVTGSLAVPEDLYGIIRIVPGKSLEYASRPLDVAGYAERAGLEDPNLRDFAAFGWSHFSKVTYDLFYARYQASGLAAADCRAAAELAAFINPYYFSGRAGEIRDQVLADPRYAEVSALAAVRADGYFSRALARPALSQRELKVELGGEND